MCDNVLDVINKDEEKLVRAKQEFLIILPRLAMFADSDVYKTIIDVALPAGFDAIYGSYVGNSRIQRAIEDASELVRGNHGVFCDALLGYLEPETLPERRGWFYHGMRDIILRLMTNSACSDANAEKLNKMLAIINQLQRDRTKDNADDEVV